MFGNKLRRKGSNNGSSALPERVPEGPGRRDKHYRNGNNQLIECRRLVKTYHSPAGDFPALKEIDLQVDAGEFVAVIGKSGSGKSTLVNMITGIDRPTGGEVLVGDTCREQGKKLMAEMVIRVDRLSATYGRRADLVQALQDVSLEIQAGEIFGLLGPGGAGKTTLLSCVEGLHKPAYTEFQSGAYGGFYRPERIVVLVTPRTFSSGFTMAWHLYLAGATLVGTLSAQASNCFGENIMWELEHTKIGGSVSGSYFNQFPNDPELGRVLPVHYPLTYEKLSSYDFDPNAEYLYALEYLSENGE